LSQRLRLLFKIQWILVELEVLVKENEDRLQVLLPHLLEERQHNTGH
jgi:hypothetical protein